MMSEITEQEKKELRKIRKETESPKEETKNLPLIKNTYKINKKEVSQYKINIPKKFADFVQLEKGGFEVKSTLNKEENKIIFEVIKND